MIQDFQNNQADGTSQGPQKPIKTGWTQEQNQYNEVRKVILNSTDLKKTIKEVEFTLPSEKPLQQLKQFITSKYGLGPEYIILVKQGTNEKIVDNNISDGTRINIDKLSLSVKFQDGEELQQKFSISPLDTLKDLKEMIKKRTNLDAPNQRLLIKDKDQQDQKLEGNSKQLFELSIVDGALIEIGFLQLEAIQQNGAEGEKSIMVKVDPRGTGMDLGKQIQNKIQKGIQFIELYDESNKPIPLDTTSLASLGIKNHFKIFFQIVEKAAQSESPVQSNPFPVENEIIQVQNTQTSELANQPSIKKTQKQDSINVNANANISVKFQMDKTRNSQSNTPPFQETFRSDDLLVNLRQRCADRLRCERESLIVKLGNVVIDITQNQKTLAELDIQNNSKIILDLFGLIAKNQTKERFIEINPNSTIEAFQDLVIEFESIDPSAILKLGNQILTDNPKQTISSLRIQNGERITIEEPKDQNEVSGERVPLTNNNRNTGTAGAAGAASSQPQQIQIPENQQQSHGSGEEKVKSHSSPEQILESQNTPLSYISCIILASILIILVLIPVFILRPSAKNPEYNVRQIDGLCGGDDTYFTYGTLIYDRNPTYSEIVSKLPANYKDEQVYSRDPSYWDYSEFRVFGYTSKDILVMNKLKQNSNYKLTYYCVNGQKVSQPTNIEFKVDSNKGYNNLLHVRSTKANLTPKMQSVIACLIADELGIDRRRVFTTDGNFCYTLVLGLDASVPVSPELVKKRQYPTTVQTQRLLEGESVIAFNENINNYDYKFNVLQDVTLFDDSAESRNVYYNLKDNNKINNINERIHELYVDRAFDIMPIYVQNIDDNLSRYINVQTKDSEIKASVSNIGSNSLKLSYTLPSTTDVGSFYYRFESNPVVVASILSNWPANQEQFNIFDRTLTEIDVTNLQQGSDYVILFGTQNSQLSKVSFRTCPEGCAEGSCDSATNLCTSCIDGLIFKDGFCCDSSCGSCNGPTSNHCLTCKEDYQSVDLDGSCQCALGFYTGDDNECHKCFADCTRCNSPDQYDCTRCDSENEYQTLRESSCGCLDGYYNIPISMPVFLKAQESIICLQCDDLCGTCEGVDSYCTSCNQDDFRILNLINNTCECQDGYFSSGSPKCYACLGDCATCEQSNDYCTECKDTDRMAVNGKCVCQFGTYEGSNGNCLSCHFSCMECSGGSASQCKSCWPFRIPEYIQTSINPTTKKEEDLMSCHCNPDLSYPDDAQECLPCNDTCASCSGPEQTDCTKCAANRSYFNQEADKQLCVCLSGFFDSKGDCLPCHSTCESCFGATRDYCSSCSDKRVLLGNRCICNSQFYYETSSGECLDITN